MTAEPGEGVRPTLLATLTGHDRPGVTAAVFSALARTSAEVLDVQQLVVRGHLTLVLLTTLGDSAAPGTGGAGSGGRGTSAASALRRAADALDLTLTTSVDAIDVRRGGQRVHVTVLATVLARGMAPAALGGVSAAIASTGANIDRIRRLSRAPLRGVAGTGGIAGTGGAAGTGGDPGAGGRAAPVMSVEMDVSGADPGELRRLLGARSAELGVDVAVSPAGLARHGRRLVVLDVDSTLIQDEVIELLAAHAGRGPQVAAVTARAMAGELDFAASLHERVAALAGLDAAVLDQVRAAVRLTPGAATLCRVLRHVGFTLGVVSGGFVEVVAPLAAGLGITHVRANALEVEHGRLTGRVLGPVVDRAAKADALRGFAAAEGLPMDRTVAVGDGANDLDMLAAAGLGIAFNAKPVVRDQADAALSAPYLDSVLYLLGITREEVDEAGPAPDLTPARR